MADSLLLTATRFTVLDTNGNPVSGAKIHTYVAGSSTNLATYTDAALTVANANPVVCDSAGRAVIFLQNLPYKIVVADSADVTLYSQDNVNGSAPAVRTACNGRITGTTASPVTDTAGSATIYFTPYLGNSVSLYTSGGAWVTSTFSEVSLALGADASATNYDLFLQNVGGTLTLKRVAWSSATARASALALQDGIYVLGSDLTQRYLGTYRTISTGTVADSVSARFIWNYYNRVPRIMRKIETTDNWNYTVATYQQANNSAANQLSLVVGIAEVMVEAAVLGIGFNTNAGVNMSVSIGFDSATTPVSGVIGMITQSPAVSVATDLHASVRHMPTIGYHFYAWLEQSAATGTTTWVGDGGAPSTQQAGIHGSVLG
jgi:hypothetical protein